jgi:hypothetical protein
MGVEDIRLYGLNIMAFSLSLTAIEPILKIILLMLSIGYTIIKIHSHFENKIKNKK